MILHKKLFSLLLAGTMLLSLAACGSTADQPAPSASPSAQPSPSAAPESLLPDDFVADTSAEDICLAVLGVPGSSTLFTVNGAPVTAYSYLYHLISSLDYMAEYMAYFGLSLDLTADPTIAEYAREEALSSAVMYSLLASKAGELGYPLTEAQVNELEVSLALTAEYMGGEEAFRDELRKAGFDYDSFYAVNAASYYYTQLKTGLFSDRTTDAEMDAYIEENDILLAKHILLMTVDSTTRQPLDDAAIAQKKATAEDILARLQSSGDLLADFDALMHEYSEDPGLISSPDGYTFTAGDMVPEFEAATRALEFGQISGIVESSSTGYHIILRLDPDTETARAEYQDTLMGQQLDAWAAEAVVDLTDEYNAIDVALFYETYLAYQTAFAEEAAAAEAQATASPDPAAEGGTN